MSTVTLFSNTLRASTARIFLLLAILGAIPAATQTIDWAKSMGGISTDIGNAIAFSKGGNNYADAAGNVYVTGQFRQTADFNPGAATLNLTSAGSFDFFISKLGADGQFKWAKSIGGGFGDVGYAIAADAAGNVYIAGRFEGTVDFDPGIDTFFLTSAGSFDVFVSKLDSEGNFMWAKSMGGTKGDEAYSIAVDAAGNVYTTGKFEHTADFDPGEAVFNLTSQWQADAFISKLDANGNFLWAKSIGGSGSIISQSIAIDGAGSVYTTGSFGGIVDFDPGTATHEFTSTGGDDIFISKLDGAGQFVWAKVIAGVPLCNSYAVALDDAGNVYTTGRFHGTIDFDPSMDTFNLTSAGGFDAFISKLNSDGGFLWAKRIGGLSSDEAYSIAVGPAGEVYITGEFKGTVDFDPGPGSFNLTSAGGADAFVNSLDTDGNWLWAKRIGGALETTSRAIAVDDAGNAYTTGGFEGSVPLDLVDGVLTLNSAGGFDVFVQKMASSPVAVNNHPKEAPSVNIYPNPNDGRFTVETSSPAKMEVFNVAGQFLFYKILNPGKNNIELNHLGRGAYFIAVAEENGVKSTQLIVIEQ